MKYDIIYSNDSVRWQRELSEDIYLTILGFLKEFAEDNNKKPEVKSLILGLDVWFWLTLHDKYCHIREALRMYDIWLDMPSPDWTVSTLYIELNLV